MYKFVLIQNRSKSTALLVLIPVSGCIWKCIEPGGTHIGKWYGDVSWSWPPFFQASRRSLAYQFTKFCIFSLVWPKFQLTRHKFSKFLFRDPHFSRKICSVDPTFGNPVWHTPTKKSLVPPPPDIETQHCMNTQGAKSALNDKISGLFKNSCKKGSFWQWGTVCA